MFGPYCLELLLPELFLQFLKFFVHDGFLPLPLFLTLLLAL